MCIEEALIEQANEEEFAAITITNLCKRAGIGRQTFYRHFANKEDVIRSKIRNIFNNYKTYLQTKKEAADSVDFVNLETLRFWKANQTLFQLVRIESLRTIIFSELDLLMDRLVKLNLVHSEMDPYLMNFRHWGMKGVLLIWAENGMEQTPEEINAVLRSVNGIQK